VRTASGAIGQLRWASRTGRWLGAAVAVVLILWHSAGSAFADAVDDRTRQIAKRLQCPVCEGVSVADSTSELASEMRTVIRRKLEQGESETQILEYFVARYGDGILVEPPRRGFSLIVWLGPMLALAVGGVLLGLVLRAWSRPRWATAATTRTEVDSEPPSGALSDSDGAYRQRARRELEQVRRES
jgi:cytochrome c-type biogenesis protein CcmH